MAELVGRLLSALHGWLRVQACPGEWPWTVTLAGAVFGLVPVLGAVAVAVARRWTGNRYGPAQLASFCAIGLLTVGLLPAWLFGSTDRVLTAAWQGRAVGLRPADLESLERGLLCVGLADRAQSRYLGASASAWNAVTEGGSLARLAALVFLVLVPLLAVLLVYLQARIAFGRGPVWPARIFALPVLLPLLVTAPLGATVLAHVWGGFMLSSAVGILAVLVVGRPRWAVLNDGQVGPPPAGHPGAPGYPGRPASYPRPAAPSMRQPVPPPARRYPPTMIAPGSAPPGGGRLAAEPGPLPSGLTRQPLARAATGSPADATALLPTSRFQRIRPLGSGGFGQVWLVRDTTLGREVAVKVATAANAETQQRIQREARALAAVDHPNCVRIYDIIDDLDGGGLAIVMEYVPGEALTDTITRARYGDRAAGRLWSTLAGALHAAHGEGLLHRDVKPSNIIVDNHGEPRLIDFGIARATGDVTLTAAGMVVGTPDFIPPELAAGRPAEPSSDGWQLAATVSYTLTGTPPRGHSDGAMAAMLAAVRGEPCNQLPAASAHLGLLRRALGPDPAERPTLPDVQRELEPWLAGRG